jgi:demethoxyubiquinone hydroxylase (CLK1/Coq7/Cat5 family)
MAATLCGASENVEHCFVVARRRTPEACRPRLAEPHALALAALLPILGCGEEAAVAGFDRLGRSRTLDHQARIRLQMIAEDERHHDALLSGLRLALPPVALASQLQSMAQRFHAQLGRGGAAFHLARIAGLDSAVCTILSRLLRPDGALADDRAVTQVLGQIRRDEVQHVLASRGIALAAPDRSAIRRAAAEAREGLAELLTTQANAFEVLRVDPDRLLHDVARLPDGLLPQ